MAAFDPQANMAACRHHFGEHGGVNMSIEASTTFTVMQADKMPAIFQGRFGPDQGGCYLYGRHFNPTVYALGHQLAAMEGAQAGYCTASGLGAISAVLMQLCEVGSHIVSSDTIYGGTHALLKEFLPKRMGVQTNFVDVRDLGAVDAAMSSDTRLLYVESMANPTLKIADITALAAIAHRHGAQLVVDNTFTPMMLSPIQLGADIVVHSLTKFINGASDIVAGAICGSTEFITSLMDLHDGAVMLLGPTMDPKQAFEVNLRLPHLGLRMREHSARAAEFALRLQVLGAQVIYPGLESHPDHVLANTLFHAEYGYGGLLAIDMGSTERAFAFMDDLQNNEQFGYMAVSLGYFDTLMSCSATSTSSELDEEELRRAGIAPGLVRMSLGITGTLEQRWQQLQRAYNSAME
ncbi:MAG: aminotransferase class I/II-fold pyridoxal phosphate-dependent enzyme [Oceanococcus sp.]